MADDKDTGLMFLTNSPDLVFWLILAIFGGTIAGVLLIGIGVLLVPATLIAAYFLHRHFKKGK